MDWCICKVYPQNKNVLFALLSLFTIWLLFSKSFNYYYKQCLRWEWIDEIQINFTKMGFFAELICLLQTKIKTHSTLIVYYEIIPNGDTLIHFVWVLLCSWQCWCCVWVIAWCFYTRRFHGFFNRIIKKIPFCEPQIVIMEAEHDTEYIYSTAMWAHLSGDILLHIVIELIIDFASFSGKFLIHDISFASRREHWKLLNLNRINLEKSELSNLALFENFG